MCINYYALSGGNYMAKIVGVNSTNYIDKRKLESKLSFKEGEKFFAKICSADKKTGEVTLKLPNGWEFKANVSKNDLKENFDLMEGKVIKFQVEDFLDGKLQLSISEGISNEELTSSLKNILEKLDLEPSKENVELLSKMIKHDISLTKDNIYIFKNTMFIKQRISKGEGEIDNMTKLFLIKCNIDKNAPEASFIEEHLKEFFGILKNTDNDVLLSLKENNLDMFSKDNINSMKTLNEGDNIFKKSIEELLITFRDGLDIENLVNTKVNVKFSSEDNSKANINSSVEENSKPNLKVRPEDNAKPNLKASFEENVKLNVKVSPEENALLNSKDNITSQKEVIIPSKEKLQELSRVISRDEKIKDSIVKQLDLNNEFNFSHGKLMSEPLSTDNIKEMIINDFTKNILLGSLKVKEDIEGKVNDLKNLISEVLELKQKLDPSIQKELVQGIKESINNIKVLNSLTDQYYYLDSPLKYKNKEHEFKLIIKNNNKNKHEFDTKCVKIFTSIKTINMGYVDNFININNNNMQIKICCSKHFMKLMGRGKNDLIEAIRLIGYLPSVVIEERREETTVSSSAEFFQDQTFTMINQLV